MNEQKVFISYSHDSEEHHARVRALADRLRREGVACTIDQYDEFPAEGWPAWMRHQLHDADFVLVVCTRTYFQRLMEDERPGVGLGARFEGRMIEQSLYEWKGRNEKFIPILFNALDAEWIPDVLRSYSYFRVDTEEGYTALYRYLTRQPKIIKPDVGAVKRLPPDGSLVATQVLEKKVAKGVLALLSTLDLRRRWRWGVAVALLAGSGFAVIWWTSHRPSRLYDQGRRAMAALDFPVARMLFEQALAHGDLPVVRSALAEALMRLGKDDLAAKEAQSARERSQRLSPKDRLLVEARCQRVEGEWDEALLRYQELHKREPGEVEYALGVAELQSGQGHCLEALSTVREIQKKSEDARLDLAQGMAAYCASNSSLVLEAASRATRKAEEHGFDLLAAEGLLLSGIARANLGNLNEALTDLESSEKRARTRDHNELQVARVQNAIAGVLGQQGDLNQARQWYGKARKTYHNLGDTVEEAAQELYLANISDQEGELGRARTEYETAAVLFRNLGFQVEEAGANGSLGSILARQGDLAGAAEHLETAIAIFGESGDREQKAAYLCRLSELHLEKLEPTLAKKFLNECAASARDVKTPHLEADILLAKGKLFRFQGRLESAWKAYQNAREIYAKIGRQGEVARSLLALSTLQLERNLASQAQSLVESGLEYFREQRALDDEAMAQVLLARTYVAQGVPQRALSSIDEVKGRVAESEDLDLRVQAALVEARALAALGKLPEARQVIQRQLDDAPTRRHPRLWMETRLAQGELEALHGDRGHGRELLALLEEDARARGFGLVEAKAARLRAGS